ncbi:hypothetical protein Glove_396g105 [Diversispora epigaea]|uniref:F-box domain-containing protein n=1 Tax=Diversispora epigaea TaxID=1348612 RepID=A0A397H167_9GLOM|nr:hypothetical protein Glove_396g105 [Diversispora epigaea]
MIVKLDRDCLWQIFSNLEHDKKSLHSTILVNRIWCEIAIQFLWKKPFRYLYTCPKACGCVAENRHKKARNLLSTFITCMAHNQTSNSIDIQDFVVWTASPPTTFNYLSFLRHIDLYDLFLTLKDGVKYLISNQYFDFVIAYQRHKQHKQDNYQQQQQNNNNNNIYSSNIQDNNNWESKVIQEMSRDICKLLVLHCSNLKNLSIDMANKIWLPGYRCSSLPNISFWITFDEIPIELLKIPTYSGSINCLSQLVEFYWGSTHWTSEFLVALSKVSRKLKKLVIDMSNFGRNESITNAQHLGKLIVAQTALQDIEFIKCKPTILPVIMQGLRTQSKTLSRFFFQGMVKDFSVFSELVHCINLQEIYFIQCNFRCSEVEMLSVSHFPKLIKLIFNIVCFRFPIIIPEILLQNSGKKIRTFSLQQFYYPVNINSDGFIPSVASSVAKYCPNLVEFEYFVTKKEFPQLALLFASCPHLERVTLSGKYENVEELLPMLANQELPNLREFEILGYWTFSSSSLETFFIQSKAPLKKFIISYSPCFSDDHMEVILRCFGNNNNKLSSLHVETKKELSEEILIKANTCIQDFVYKTINDNYETFEAGRSGHSPRISYLGVPIDICLPKEI